jgi:hypothetical protein
MRASLAILLILASTTLCNIGPGSGLASAKILTSDFYSQDLTEVFDWSAARYPVNTTTTNGKIFSSSVPFNAKNFQAYNVQKLYLVKWISHNMAAFVFDNNKVIIQTIDGNGKIFLKSFFKQFNTPANLFCTGFEYNDVRNLVYIGCFSPSTQSTPGKFLIATYDLGLEDVVTTVNLD